MKNEFINHDCLAGLQPADYFSRDGKMVQTDCNLLLYLTNKHDFFNFGWGNCLVASFWLQACYPG